MAKFIILNGPSCSGKSAILKKVLTEKENLFHLSYDTVKWMFPHYSPPKHAEEVRAVLLAIAGTVCGLDYDIVCDSALLRSWREKLADFASTHGYDLVEINLEADYPILEKRFEGRLEEAERDPEKKHSNLSRERFKELFDTYEREKNPSAITFRTDVQAIGEIADRIAELI